MILLANILHGVGLILDMALQFFIFVIFIRAVLSWVNADPYNPLVRFFSSVTDPLMYKVRRHLPVTYGMIDFSPLILLFGAFFLRVAIAQSLMDYAASLRSAALLGG